MVRDIKTIGKIINEFCNQKKSDKVYEAFLRSRWKVIFPEAITSRTEKLTLNNDTLLIKLSSATLKHEFLIIKDKIMQKINQDPFLERKVVNIILL